ncbi:MAG: hypothetical protein V2I82_11685, partial [Halieaceae bacterium]|nr:hypothetical protein [Halieaceae bacterium]
MRRITSIGCLALFLLLGPSVVSAQDRRLERIEATIADVCDARMRCIGIVSDELQRRCGRDLACVRRNLDDLRARKEADEITIADLSRQIDELEALLNEALAAQSPGSSNDEATQGSGAGPGGIGAASDDSSAGDENARGGAAADVGRGSAGSGAIRRGSIGEIAERRAPGGAVGPQRERDPRGVSDVAAAEGA